MSSTRLTHRISDTPGPASGAVRDIATSAKIDARRRSPPNLRGSRSPRPRRGSDPPRSDRPPTRWSPWSSPASAAAGRRGFEPMPAESMPRPTPRQARTATQLQQRDRTRFARQSVLEIRVRSSRSSFAMSRLSKATAGVLRLTTTCCIASARSRRIRFRNRLPDHWFKLTE